MSVAPSRRARLVAAIADRLETIRTSGGFATNAGEMVSVGYLPILGKDDPDVALALTIGTDIPNSALAPGKKVTIQLPLTVHLQVKGTSDDAWMTVEAGIADVKKAMEQITDRTVQGLIQPEITRGNTTTLARASGDESQGARLVYTLTYEEAFGDPIGV